MNSNLYSDCQFKNIHKIALQNVKTEIVVVNTEQPKHDQVKEVVDIIDTHIDKQNDKEIENINNNDKDVVETEISKTNNLEKQQKSFKFLQVIQPKQESDTSNLISKRNDKEFKNSNVLEKFDLNDIEGMPELDFS